VKTLILDIETFPSLAYIWSLWDDNVPLQRVVDVGTVACWAAKWHGSRKVMFASDFHNGHADMVGEAYEVIEAADAIVHFNGRSFDIKHLQREFVLAGMSPPRPHKDIDLLTVARGQFKFLSNKLEHVSEQLGVGSKVRHPGFEMWVRCMEGDPKAWAQMRRYNIGDVNLTDRVYDRLKPWIKGHPSPALYEGDFGAARCPNCGSDDLEKRGRAYTQLGAFQQYRCRGCGTWTRGGKRLGGVDIRRST
jgi:hypothetical protein